MLRRAAGVAISPSLRPRGVTLSPAGKLADGGRRAATRCPARPERSAHSPEPAQAAAIAGLFRGAAPPRIYRACDRGV
ncbi:MAG: hypothetical protein DCC68_08585 [Planctomycetota bacterium]|nr:MAG: hypothetical protein DCC68_08585 [Planctomycetota bacterium]